MATELTAMEEARGSLYPAVDCCGRFLKKKNKYKT